MNLEHGAEEALALLGDNKPGVAIGYCRLNQMNSAGISVVL